MEENFLQTLRHLGFTARIKRLNERIVASTLQHYSALNLDIEPNWHVIFLLLKERKQLTVTDISNSLGFSHPAIIKIVRKMKERGYVDLSKDTKDARKTHIQLSKAAKKVLPRYEDEWRKIEVVLTEVVDDEFLDKLDQLEETLQAKSFKDRYEAKFGSPTLEKTFTIRNAKPSEFKRIGQLIVAVYSGLEGFPKADEQPEYYNTLAQIGEFTKKSGVELLVAVSDNGKILGGVLYFSNMKNYGSGGTAPMEQNASGFRLLAVDPAARGLGIGKALSLECIARAKMHGHQQILIHSTAFMKLAQRMYRKLGFKRSQDLDFEQRGLQVHGFRLNLE